MPIPRIEREVSRLEAEVPQTVTQLHFVSHESGFPFGLLGDELVLNSCASARTEHENELQPPARAVSSS